MYGTAQLEAAPARTRLVRLARGVSLGAELRRLRASRGVRWAVPDYVAHEADVSIPNDVAREAQPGTGSSCSGTSPARSGWRHPKRGRTWPPTAPRAGKG